MTRRPRSYCGTLAFMTTSSAPMLLSADESRRNVGQLSSPPYAATALRHSVPIIDEPELRAIFRHVCEGLADLAQPPGLDSYGEALNSFEHALARDPQYTQAKGWLANALVGRVLDLHPQFILERFETRKYVGEPSLGSIARRHACTSSQRPTAAGRRCDEAIPEFEMVIASNRNSSGALFALGECKLLTGSIDEVSPLEEQAIRLGPAISTSSTVIS
jgi:tetratricopeptide (TPR) repeat protein